jgi:hypothetical protein
VGRKRISDFDNQFPNNAEVKRNFEKYLEASKKYEQNSGGRLGHLEQLWFSQFVQSSTDFE